MALRATSTGSGPEADPVGRAMAETLSEMLDGVSADLTYAPVGIEVPTVPGSDTSAIETGPGPPGWTTTVTVQLDGRIARLVQRGDRATSLAELLQRLPGAGLRAAGRFRRDVDERTSLDPALRRAMRDTVAAELLADYLSSRVGVPARPKLIAEIIDYFVELSGTRIEAHDVTHGVVVADVLVDSPRLEFRYPSDIRTAKRAPLLFDGLQSVLVVDPQGRARTELQQHRFDRLFGTADRRTGQEGSAASGSLVASASGAMGGLGVFLRADRSIWTFVDGQPLLVRRGEHWTAFPLELTASIANMIGGRESVAGLVARAAFIISAQPRGAILAIVDDPSRLDGVVSEKDRYDRRDLVELADMRPETRLHHLIDGSDLDEHVLAHVAVLDGATVVDRDGHLLAYGAIVSSADSQHEGARTAAAKTLSQVAEVVLKLSVDGDITIFRRGVAVATLLSHPDRSATYG